MQYFLFHNSKLLLTADNDIPVFCKAPIDSLPFSINDGVECVASTVDNVPFGLHEIGLRDSYDVLSSEKYLRAGKAFELLNWNNSHKYCGYCGALLKATSTISKKCTNCGREIWPSISPAIIVLIYDKDRVLLVRSNTFKGSFYGLVAGFVEFGESIEETVVREITEETQLQVENVKYFGSQPWPYPQGIMLGFFAHYKSGEVKLQESELVAGGWFDIHNLPQVPGPASMARKLIDYYIEHNSLFTDKSH